MFNKVIKRIIGVSVAMITVGVMLSGCSSASPKDVVNDYFKGISKGDNKKATELLVESGMNIDPELVEVGNEKLKEAQKITMDNFKKIKWTVNSEDVKEDKATVNITVKGPNLMKAMTNYFTKILEEGFKSAFSGEEGLNEEKTEELVSTLLVEEMKKAESDERKGDINLLKTDGKWKIEQNFNLINVVLGDMSSIKSNKTK